ncbi:MAG TPA: hypothetical protein VFE46_18205 [Pirellulales bacterium]|nr:hypothetical protein [Pirellulales bacterium]
MLASIFEPIHRFLTHPQLVWILLWLGLAFLIVTLIVMIRTSWGQSHPLRKCVALSLLAHLLLLCYATSVHIVTANGNGHTGGMSLLLVDGGENGNDSGTDDGPDQPSVTVADSAESISASAPPLLKVAEPSATTLPKPVEQPMVAPAITETAQPTAPQPTTSDEPRPTSVAEKSTPADVAAVKPDDKPEKPSEPLPTDAPPAPLTKLPDPPTTNDSSEWVAGDPRGTATPAQPTIQGPPKTVPLVDSPESKSADNIETNPAPKDDRSTVAVRVPATTNAAANNSTTSNAGVTAPWVENAAAPVAGRGVPEIYSDRIAPNRAEIGRRRGGSPGSESAVEAALQWLALHQGSDGGWDASKFGAHQETAEPPAQRQGAGSVGSHADTAMTGLALLAFLGAGNTHQRGDYAANVQRGLEFLINSQARDGNLAGQAETYAFMYSHGMATLAVSEAYAMTGDKRLEPTVSAAINYTLSAQIRTTGGWRYRATESPGERGDTSQLGWQWMSLKSAQLAGINIPASASDGAVRYIKSVSAGQFGGKASYRPGERPTRPMTAEALVCRQFLGMARDNPASDEAGQYLLSDLPRPDRINLYYWYYGTLGMYQLQGDAWKQWNEALQNTLIGKQRTDGDLAGSWDPECIWGGYGGRVYSTALSALCLEVYYRYLPLYQANRQLPQAADK